MKVSFDPHHTFVEPSEFDGLSDILGVSQNRKTLVPDEFLRDSVERLIYLLFGDDSQKFRAEIEEIHLLVSKISKEKNER